MSNYFTVGFQTDNLKVINLFIMENPEHLGAVSINFFYNILQGNKLNTFCILGLWK